MILIEKWMKDMSMDFISQKKKQMEIGRSITYAHTHQVYVLNVINNQRTANKNKM